MTGVQTCALPISWSRSNRWFHEQVVKLSIANNVESPLSTAAFENNTRARRPIIEFYPNLKLYQSGIFAKKPIDFIDNRTTDAFTDVAGHKQYYPDTASYTEYTATINGVSGPITGVNIASTSNFTNSITLASGTTNNFAKNDPIIFATNIGGVKATYTYYIYDKIGRAHV